MSQSTGQARTSVADTLAAAGVHVEAEGLQSYRARLAAVRAKLTPARVNEMRSQVGLPPLDPA